MTDERRLRRFVIDPRELMGLLRGDTAVDLRPFPADAEALCWGWDANSRVLVVMVRSAEYDPVPIHREAPFSMNGPTFASLTPPPPITVAEALKNAARIVGDLKGVPTGTVVFDGPNQTAFFTPPD